MDEHVEKQIRIHYKLRETLVKRFVPKDLHNDLEAAKKYINEKNFSWVSSIRSEVEHLQIGGITVAYLIKDSLSATIVEAGLHLLKENNM